MRIGDWVVRSADYMHTHGWCGDERPHRVTGFSDSGASIHLGGELVAHGGRWRLRRFRPATDSEVFHRAAAILAAEKAAERCDEPTDEKLEQSGYDATLDPVAVEATLGEMQKCIAALRRELARVSQEQRKRIDALVLRVNAIQEQTKEQLALAEGRILELEAAPPVRDPLAGYVPARPVPPPPLLQCRVSKIGAFVRIGNEVDALGFARYSNGLMARDSSGGSTCTQGFHLLFPETLEPIPAPPARRTFPEAGDVPGFNWARFIYLIAFASLVFAYAVTN